MANGGSIDERMRFAIANRRLLQVRYDDAVRILEPHDYGVLNKTEKLFAYQQRNLTRPTNERDTHWRLLELSKIEECVVLDETFPGSRGDEHSKHLAWEILYARVR